MSLIEKVKTWKENQLATSFKNVTSILATETDQQKIRNAQEMREAIQERWKILAIQAKKGEHKTERPEQGILGYLGYKVGNEGDKLSIRRKILEFIVEEDLPFVGSPGYMDEWGDKATSERLKKLSTTIANLLREKISYKDEKYSKAILEWSSDLDWLKDSYYEKLNNFKWPIVKM